MGAIANFLGGFRKPQPTPLGADERRSPPFSDFPRGGLPTYVQHPVPSVGANKFSFQSHLAQIDYNPIGAGVVYGTPFRPIGQRPSRYLRGAIVFGFQQVNFGRQPQPGGPLWTPGQLAAMMGRYDLAANMTAEQAAGFGPPLGTPSASAFRWGGAY